MKRAVARRHGASLARRACVVLTLAAACGTDVAPGLPPVPENQAVLFPGPGGAGWFYARLGDVAYQDRVEDWLLKIDPDGRAWLGSAAAGGPQWASPGAPPPSGTLEVRLPVGDYAWSGNQRALWSLLPGEMDLTAALDTVPAQFAAGLQMVPAPEELESAYDLALGRALLQRLVALVPALLGDAEGVLHGMDTLPTLDLRFAAGAAGAAPQWRPAWQPRGIPKGVGMARWEVPGDDLRRDLAAILDQWGYEWPAPEGDFAAELHLLSLRGKVGLAFFTPESWAPQLDWVSEALPSVLPVLPMFPAMPSAGAMEAERFVSHGDVVWAAGPEGFLHVLREELERDRPPPFAERRWRWPRGAVGVIVDMQAMQELLRSASPIPIPQLGGGGAQERVLEALLVQEGTDLRVHAVFPSMSRGTGQMSSLLSRAGDFLGAELFEEMLGELGLERLEEG